MKKIKLIYVYDHYHSYDDYDDQWSHVLKDASEWNEVSDEEFNFIKLNLWLLDRSNKSSRDGHYIIVEHVDTSVPDIITNIKKELEKIEKQRQKEEAELQKKKEEAAQKRAEKKLLRDKKALEKLIRENPNLLDNLKNA